MRATLGPDFDLANTQGAASTEIPLIRAGKGPAGRPYAVLVATDDGAETILGFAEAHLRDYADGCTTSPVGYLEAWYVAPEARGRGLGRELVLAARDWCREHGASEFFSDTDLHNTNSIEAHKRLGFTELYRTVQFRLDD